MALARKGCVNVHVVGGGIGGLAVTVGLLDRGIVPTVHESATELRSVGAGISLGSNAIAALARLGLADEVLDAGEQIHRLRVVDPRGRPLRTVDLTTTIEGESRPYVYVHRAALQEVLLDPIPSGVLRLGETCSSVDPGPPTAASDHPATIQFEDGGTTDAGLVVGADGIDSVVRRAVVDPDARRDTSRRRDTGTITYRGLARGEGGPSNETLQVWGWGTRVGIAPLGDGRYYWFATANEHVADPTRPGAVLEALRERLVRYPSPVPELLDETPTGSLIVTELSDVAPLPRWHAGRVVLLGDAAHAPLPYLGQGAGQALEDAVALSRRLGSLEAPEPAWSPSTTRAEALNAYERVRKSRAEWIVRASRLWWRLAQMGGPLARARNLLVRYGPETVADHQQRWLASSRY